MKPEIAAKQKAAGLPPEPLLTLRRTFEPSSETIVLSFSVERDGSLLPQTYLRRINESRYTSAGELLASAHGLAATNLATETPVVGPGGQLFCLLVEHGPRSTAGVRPVSSLGIAGIDLVTRSSWFWPRARDFFATELVGTTADGARLFAIVGVERRTEDGVRVVYAVAELDVSRRAMIITTELLTPFY